MGTMTMISKLDEAMKMGVPENLLRAVACACCRQAWHRLPEDARAALVAAEMYTRGEATELGLLEAMLRAESAESELYASKLACRAVALACREDVGRDRNGYGLVDVPKIVADALTCGSRCDCLRNAEEGEVIHLAQGEIFDRIIPGAMLAWLRENPAPAPQDTVIRDGFVLSGADPDKVTFYCSCCNTAAHVPIGWGCSPNNPDPRFPPSQLFCPACRGTASAVAVVDAVAAWDVLRGDVPGAAVAAEAALCAHSAQGTEWREQYRAMYVEKWQQYVESGAWTASDWDNYNEAQSAAAAEAQS
jgi:hypothetical protein